MELLRPLTFRGERLLPGRGTALVGAVVVMFFAFAQGAFAQTGSAGGLSVTVGTSTNDPPVGETFYYGVRVSNGASSPVAGAVLEIIFPPSFRSDGAVPPAGCTPIPLGLTCPLGSLAVGETRELYFPGHFGGLDDGATIARVRDATGAVTVEVERADNDGDGDNGDRRRGGNGADLSLTQRDSPDPVAFEGIGGIPTGERIQYRSDIRNRGPRSAADVTFTSEVTNGVIRSVSSNDNSQDCAFGGFTSDGPTTATCTYGPQARGADFFIVVDVEPTSPGTTSNGAAVTSSTPDPNPDNNRESDSTTVQGGRDNAGRSDRDPPRHDVEAVDRPRRRDRGAP